VKECGISPLDIPHLTPFQKKALILQHNRIMREREREIEKLKSERHFRKPKVPRRRRPRRG